ncbi:alpha-amylase family glycosyl hydrolase [Thalassobaculum salexigens]|uniref:alpha-amylase family glycosyl hydrolase n=1 Tax=Thalassobaculum salexigens TaxID=455360 RepID=UPI0004006B2E|nr:alpha-amylase family glycosyl hydrolase [Thalassobaculum salexigens]
MKLRKIGKAETSDYEQKWWRGATIYEIYVRSFRDSNGDGIGDLGGVLEKIDHIASLGVDAVWLSPFYKSPQKDYGYDIEDFRLVDPSAGTMEDFLRLRDAVHARGMRLLLDFVPCHTSDQHPWFQESRSSRDNPKADWYVWADQRADGCPPNNWLSSFGGTAWTWEPRRSQYYYHPFLTEQPALNLHNEEVLDHIIQEMEYWCSQGVDGFRIDAVQCLSWDRDLRDNPPVGREGSHVMFGGGPTNPFARQHHLFDRNAEGTEEILARFRQFADEQECVLIGELADIDTPLAAPDLTGQGRRLHAVYDFNLINCPSDVEALTEQLRRREELMGASWVYNVLTNHDSTRALSNLTYFAVDTYPKQAAKLLLFMQLTLKGGCILYQGDELGLPHPHLEYEDIVDPWAKAFWPTFEGRDGARTPIPWSADAPQAGFSDGKPWLRVPEEHLSFAVDRQEEDADSVLNFLRRLIAWRRNQPTLRFGDEQISRWERAPIITWRRCHAGSELRAIANFATDQAFLPLDECWRPMRVPGGVTRRQEHGLPLGPLEFAVVTEDNQGGAKPASASDET